MVSGRWEEILKHTRGRDGQGGTDGIPLALDATRMPGRVESRLTTKTTNWTQSSTKKQSSRTAA